MHVPPAFTASQYFGLGVRDTTPVSSATGRNVAVVVSNARDDPPPAVVVRATAGVCGSLNVAGSTSIPDPFVRAKFFHFTSDLFGGDPHRPFLLDRIAVSSGGTRVLHGPPDRLSTVMTAVEAPGIAYLIHCGYHPDNPERRLRTWGHTPRRDTLGYGGQQSSFALTEDLDATAIPNPLNHLLWLLEKSPSEPLDWNGDLTAYFKLLRLFWDSGEGYAGNLLLGGGTVSAEEVLRSLENGIPVLAVVGTTRAADALVDLLAHRPDRITEAGIRRHYTTILDRGLDTLSIPLADGRCVPGITLIHSPEEGHVWLELMGFGRRLY